ncbi:MAG: WbqC family protein [Bergeyella sp.]|nr:WbqC family protein [Bergeyella sp.]
MRPYIFPIFYLPPVSWFSFFLFSQGRIMLEIHENFIKQTYRNRTKICSASGVLSLIIPIQHSSGKRKMKDVAISYAEDWRSVHWKSIKYAYRNSPYFEFYEDLLQKIYHQQESSLICFNLNVLEILQRILRSGQEFSFTSSYEKNPEDMVDFREKWNTKKRISLPYIKPYYQVFSEKLGFLQDLSILDLICHLGPESMGYLKDVYFLSIFLRK